MRLIVVLAVVLGWAGCYRHHAFPDDSDSLEAQTDEFGTDHAVSEWSTVATHVSSSESVAMHAIDCPTPALCVAVGENNVAFRTTDFGLNWEEVAFSSEADWYGVRCTADSVCVAVGSHGSKAVTTNVEDTWQVDFLGSVTLMDMDTLQNTHHDSVAVGALGSIFAANSEGPWRGVDSTTLNTLYGVDCTESGVCLAVGAHGTVLASQNTGSTWVLKPTPQTADLQGVVCPGSSTCVAVGMDGAIGVTNDLGQTWFWYEVAGDFYDVACLEDLKCYAVGSTTVSFVIGDSGSLAYESMQPGIGVLRAVSCPTSDLCLAVSDTGAIVRAPAAAITAE